MIARSSSAGEVSFNTYPWAPARSACVTYSWLSCTVNTMIFVSGDVLRITGVASNPPTSGMFRSIRITSGSKSWHFLIASLPVDRLTHNRNHRMMKQARPYPIANQRMVIRQQQCYLFSRRIHNLRLLCSPF